ncbi:glycosyltransferase [Aminipila terrae]|uniref:Glycosyltransferase n=1 Tax=Aminipila terrae TaxID=2697030 RepID=A0A6P1MHK0_9FIRM|nr:glycosyltransferase [Aminipila terrae]QHI72064.1 glycosyltransferase [Aminipila terrae]
MFAENMKSGQNNTVPSNNCPLVSVAVLTYNNQINIYRTLDSVFFQDYPNIELIISDDASRDFDEQNIIKYIEKKSQGNVRNVTINVNKTNLGTVAHANRVARLCNGEYIKFLACGDAFYERASLSRLQQFAESRTENVVVSISLVCSEELSKEYYLFPNARRVRIIKNKAPDELYTVLVFSNIISSVGMLLRKQFFDTNGFDEQYRYLEDFPLWLSLSRNGVKIPILDSITVKYGIGGNSSRFGTAFESQLLREDMILCYEKEIIPYLNRLSLINREFVNYQYIKLKSYENMDKYSKLLFRGRYLFFDLYVQLKKKIKKSIVRKRDA